jgi:uncharacterized membrane protein YecN with MAPEG domain
MQTPALPIVSAVTAGVLIIAQMALMLLAALQRRRARQSLGDRQDDGLLRAVRRHGNFAENAAIFIAGLALLEMIGGARCLVEGLAAVFLLGRVLHAIGLSMKRTANAWRLLGVTATVGAGVVLGVELIEMGARALGVLPG